MSSPEPDGPVRDLSAPALRLLTGEPEEMAQLARVLQGAPGYTERVTGLPPGPADAESLFAILPPGLTYEAKRTYAVMLGELMVGCADLLRGWPEPSTAHLGLLLVDEAHQRRGIGSAAYVLLEDQVRSWPEVERVRVAVVRTNADVVPFWTGHGFAPTGEVVPYRYANLVSESLIMTKELAPAVGEMNRTVL